jgi:hypothetical protein
MKSTEKMLSSACKSGSVLRKAKDTVIEPEASQKGRSEVLQEEGLRTSSKTKQTEMSAT